MHIEKRLSIHCTSLFRFILELLSHFSLLMLVYCNHNSFFHHHDGDDPLIEYIHVNISSSSHHRLQGCFHQKYHLPFLVLSQQLLDHMHLV